MKDLDRRILIVEDEDAIRSLLFAIMRRRGFHVDTARNGVEGLDRCTTCRYDIVLLDVMMPLMNGYEFLEEIGKRAWADRPMIIVLTAGVLPMDLDPDIVAGTLRKPFDVEMLVDTVGACLDRLPQRAQMDGCPPADSDTARPRTPRRTRSAT